MPNIALTVAKSYRLEAVGAKDPPLMWLRDAEVRRYNIGVANSLVVCNV